MDRIRRLGLALLLGAGAVGSLPCALTVIARDGWSLLVLVVPAYLVLVARAGPVIWPGARRVGAVLFGVLAAVVAGALELIGAYVLFGFTIAAELCGSDGSSTSGSGALIGGCVAVVLAAYAFTQPRRRLLPFIVGAIVIGVLVAMGVTEAIPSNHGTFCET